MGNKLFIANFLGTFKSSLNIYLLHFLVNNLKLLGNFPYINIKNSIVTIKSKKEDKFNKLKKFNNIFYE